MMWYDIITRHNRAEEERSNTYSLIPPHKKDKNRISFFRIETKHILNNLFDFFLLQINRLCRTPQYCFGKKLPKKKNILSRSDYLSVFQKKGSSY